MAHSEGMIDESFMKGLFTEEGQDSETHRTDVRDGEAAESAEEGADAGCEAVSGRLWV